MYLCHHFAVPVQVWAQYICPVSPVQTIHINQGLQLHYNYSFASSSQRNMLVSQIGVGMGG